MDSTKIAIAHVAGEIVIIGGISFYFSKKITALQNENEELKKRIESLEKGESGGGGLNPEQLDEFLKFQKQTTSHINNLYSVLKQIAENQPQAQQHHVPAQQTHQSQAVQQTTFTAKKNKKNVAAEVTNSKVIRTPNQVVFSTVTETVTAQPVQKKSKAVIEEIDEDEEVDEEELDRELEEELEQLKKPSQDDEEETSITDIKTESDNTEDSDQTELQFIAPPKKKKVAKKKTPAK